MVSRTSIQVDLNWESLCQGSEEWKRLNARLKAGASSRILKERSKEMQACNLPLLESLSLQDGTESANPPPSDSAQTWWDFRDGNDVDLAQTGMKNEDTPWKPSYLRSQGDAKMDERTKAELLEAKLFMDARGRFKPGLLSLALSTSSDDRRPDVQALGNQLRRAFETPSGAEHSGVTMAMQELKDAMERGLVEKYLEAAFSRVCNASANSLLGRQQPDENKGNSRITLVDVTSSRPLKAATEERPKRQARHKPDITIKSFYSAESKLTAWRDAVSICEVKTEAADDLSDDVVRQGLRYAWHLTQAHRTTHRLVFATLCGNLLRLWLVDHLMFGCSAAIDLLEVHAMDSFALALALFTGPSEGLLRSWQPHSQTLAAVKADNTRSFVTITHAKGLPIMHSDGLWGRGTQAWACKAKVNGKEKVHDVVIKTSWLPPYLRNHEDEMYNKAKGVKNIPRSFGVVDPQMVTATLPRPVISKSKPLESLAQQLVLVVVVLETEVGIPVPESLSEEQSVRVLHDILSCLFCLCLHGLHYRDVSLSNVALRLDYPRRMDRHESSIILYDLDGARFLNERRGANSSVAARKVPLGLDDATSVNVWFIGTRAMRRMKTAENYKQWASLRDAAEPGTAQHTFRQRKCNASEAELLGLDHRYVDDIQSAIWLHLIGIRHSIIGRDLCEEWKEQVDTLHTTAKAEFWQDFEMWAHKTAGVMSGEWVDMMVDIYLTLDTCLSELGADEPAWPSDAEVNTFKTILARIKSYLDGHRQQQQPPPPPSPADVKTSRRAPLAVLSPARVNLATATVTKAPARKQRKDENEDVFL